jgi:hypothetical protein
VTVPHDALAGAPTLCDELSGWDLECRGSGASVCEVYVNKSSTCDAFCDSQGAWCEAAWDDKGGCTKAKSELSRGAKSCQLKRTDQICRCRRECVDGGPWECQEEGCPARVVTCQILSVACKARFEQIWRKPPLGMAGTHVSQACPLSCGECVSAAPPPPPDPNREFLSLLRG